MVIKLLIYNPCILTFTQLNRIEYHFKERTIFTLVDKNVIGLILLNIIYQYLLMAQCSCRVGSDMVTVTSNLTLIP